MNKHIIHNTIIDRNTLLEYASHNLEPRGLFFVPQKGLTYDNQGEYIDFYYGGELWTAPMVIRCTTEIVGDETHIALVPKLGKAMIYLYLVIPAAFILLSMCILWQPVILTIIPIQMAISGILTMLAKNMGYKKLYEETTAFINKAIRCGEEGK